MAYRIEISDQADAEADAVYEWITAHSLQNGAKWYNGLFAAIHSVEEHPDRCPLAPDNDAFDREVRQLLYGKRRGVYRMLFIIEGDTVSILHVRHAARRFLNE